MLKKRRLTSEDGLTVTEVVSLSSGSSLADARAFAKLLGPQPGGFEWRIQPIEAFWQAHVPPRENARVAHQSLAWYAREITRCIRQVRAVLGRGLPSDVEAASIRALQLGWLHASACWRFNLGDQTRLGVKIRTTNRANAKKPRPRGRQDYLTPRDQRVLDDAQRERRHHPHSRVHSTRWLAGRIAQRQSCSASTVRRLLTLFGLR
jgi:hypothetical protein